MDDLSKAALIIAMFFTTAFLVRAIETSDPTYQADHGGIVNTDKETQYTKGRSYQGPGGTADTGYNQRSNMSQTGVQDVRIPLNVRQQYAAEHGMKIPVE